MPLFGLSRDVEEDVNDEAMLAGISLTNRQLNSTILEGSLGGLLLLFYLPSVRVLVVSNLQSPVLHASAG